MTFHLGNITSVEIGDQDVTPYLASLPSATLTVDGVWVDPRDETFTFPPGSTKLESYRAGKTSFTLRLAVEPWFYLWITGRRHPRIKRMHAAYRHKTRRRSR